MGQHLRMNEKELMDLSMEFQKNISAWQNWQVEKEMLLKQNFGLDLLKEEKSQMLGDLIEDRNHALLRVFQLSFALDKLCKEKEQGRAYNL